MRTDRAWTSPASGGERAASGGWRPGPGLSTILDHLRWLAALLVLLHHARLHTVGSYGSDVAGAEAASVRAFFFITGLGHEAVIGFFVLSGVLVAGRFVGRTALDAAACGDYLLDRLTRIWIVALPALVFSVLVSQIAQRTMGSFYNSSTEHCAPGLLELAANLAFLHKAFFPTLCSNGSYWSIHNEVWYYLLLPAGLLPFIGSTVWLRGGAVGFLAVALPALLQLDPWGPHNTLAYLPIWLAGALVAAGIRLRLPPALCLVALLAALALSRAVAGWHFLLKDGLVALALVILLLALRDRRLPGWCLAPALVATGRQLAGFSFSLYLTHAPVIFLIRTIVEEVAGIAMPIRAVGLPALALMSLECAAALALAWLFHLAFERHTAALRATIRARLRRRRSPACGEVSSA